MNRTTMNRAKSDSAHAFKKLTLDAAGTSDAVGVAHLDELAFQLYANGGAAVVVEVTLDTPENVKNDTARWIPWNQGAIDASGGPTQADDVLYSPISHFRLVSDGGTAELTALMRLIGKSKRGGALGIS